MSQPPDPRMPGMLGLELFVVLTTADTTMDALANLLPAHIDHQIELEKSGSLVAAGPWTNPDGRVTGGLIILRADNVEHVTDAMERDPFVSSGLFTYDIRRWRLNEGRLHVTVDFSDRTGRIS